MMSRLAKKIGTKDNPLELKTPPGTSAYTMHIDEKDGERLLARQLHECQCREQLK